MKNIFISYLFNTKRYKTVKRKPVIIVAILILLSASNGGGLFAQQMTTMGTDFWVAPNHEKVSRGEVSGAHNVNLSIILVGPRSCTATITNPNTGFDTTLTVSPGLTSRFITTLYLPWSSDTLASCGLHITATDSISVYAYAIGHSSDATNILPTYSLRDDYIIQTYPSPNESGQFYGDRTDPSCNFTIVATEDSTYVTILLQGETIAGDSTGDVISVFIPHAGLCYQAISALNSDLSGTRVTASGGKRIAVFEGNDRPYSIGFSALPLLIYEQAIPTVFWGRHFFAHNNTPYLNIVRITSLASNCTIWVNNQYVTVINEHETYEYTIPESRLLDYISTSQPSCVGVYIRNIGVTSSNIIHSEMLIVPPWEQASEGVVFGISRPTDLTQSSFPEQIHIITKTDETHMLRLDSNDISNLFHPIAANPAFSYARHTINPGGHTLNTIGGDGFLAWIHDSNFFWYSSLYSVGSALRDAQNRLTIGNITSASWIDTVEVCTNEEIMMLVESIYGFDSVLWSLGDGYSANSGQITHSFTHPGQYGVQAIVYASCDGCYHQIDTLMSTIMVFDPDTTFTDTVICGDTFVWQDSTYSEGHQLVSIIRNRHGCDSIVFSTLHFTTSTSSVIDTLYRCDSLLFYGVWYSQSGLISHDTLTNAAGCDSILYYYAVINTERSSSVADTLYGCDSLLLGDEWHFQNTLVPYDTLVNVVGCDSILFHNIIINHSYDYVQHVVINDTTTFIWIDGNTYSESTDSPFFVLQATNGCDSIIHLQLIVMPTVVPPHTDSASLWVPNVFTPSEETNKRFCIYCNNIQEAQVSIFNRQGLHIATFDGLSDCWDGTYKGHPCPQESYVYLIEYTNRTNPRYKQYKTGTVTILR